MYRCSYLICIFIKLKHLQMKSTLTTLWHWTWPYSHWWPLKLYGVSQKTKRNSRHKIGKKKPTKKCFTMKLMSNFAFFQESFCPVFKLQIRDTRIKLYFKYFWVVLIEKSMKYLMGYQCITPPPPYGHRDWQENRREVHEFTLKIQQW